MFVEYNMGNQSFQKGIQVSTTKQTSLLPFYAVSAGDFTCDEKYFTRREGVEECLLFYTLEGEGIIEYEGVKTILSPGQMMIVDCRKYHHYASHTKKWRFWWLHFAGKCAFDYVELLNENGGVPIFAAGKISVLDYYEKMKSCADRFDLKKELEISVMIQNLLTSLINMKKTEEFSQKYGVYQKELEGSIAYMFEHFSEKISIEQLASICHLSKFYYIKVFKSYTGQTPYDYLLNIRLQKAKSCLVETSKSVEEIAQECGFSESKNFIASFRKKNGMTPLQFRKVSIHV